MTDTSTCPPDCPECTPQNSLRYTNHFGKHIRQNFWSCDAAMDQAIIIDETCSANGLIRVFAGQYCVALFGTEKTVNA